jgi:hypothetical protein
MDKPYGYVRADGKGLFIYGDHQFTNNLNHDLVPVYTHPKEWEGLTDEEIDVIDEATWDEDHKSWGIHDFARAIEAKLKEKNNA